MPESDRGTYMAFTHKDSAGMTQLAQLADAGINTVHLLPSFDIATIEEDRAAQAVPDCDLASFAPDSSEQQACINAIRDADGFNWGYDPFHFSAPEGSYAVDANGGARVAEFRSMVGALHQTGLQVVLDEVFNHTAQSGQGERSVLDKVVPGYYHRLNAAGGVETSTCCQNVATEHAAAEKLMVDSVVTWARDYKVDGFRFDLMGHHSKANMLAVRAALDELTLKKDGVDGKAVYLYGEGWNFGEVANNALFEQATQGQLGGTGIGTFNDRLRDGVHGGSPVDGSSTFEQGFGTGLGTDPNGSPIDPADRTLGEQTDLVKLGLAGNLRAFEFEASDGTVKRGDEVSYNGSPAGYADQPDEVINYVDAHDNETLYDLSVFKLPTDTSMADRVRMNTVSLATVTLSQSLSFWHAGTELLRSKSLDRNSYNSGDWFNRIDWTGQESTFGSGLPMAADNAEKWPIMAPLLANPALKPAASDIATAEEAALDLLRVRSEVDLLRLGSAELIEQKVSFPNGGTDAAPGVIVMVIDDLLGEDVDPELEGALVVFNASPDAVDADRRRARGSRVRADAGARERRRPGREDDDVGCRHRHGHRARPFGRRAGRRGRRGHDRRRRAEQGARQGGDAGHGEGPGDRGRRQRPGRHRHRQRRRHGHRDRRAHRDGEGQDRHRAADRSAAASTCCGRRSRRRRVARRAVALPGAGRDLLTHDLLPAPRRSAAHEKRPPPGPDPGGGRSCAAIAACGAPRRAHPAGRMISAARPEFSLPEHLRDGEQRRGARHLVRDREQRLARGR